VEALIAALIIFITTLDKNLFLHSLFVDCRRLNILV